MSWDIIIQDLPLHAKTVSEIPDDFKPVPIGNRSEVIDMISRILPDSDFSDESLGTLERDDFSIEFNMGNNEELYSFTCHIRGSAPEIIDVVEIILEELRVRALDTQSGEFFYRQDAEASFKEWQKHRDNISEE